jgi:hypothetical protein
MHADLRKPLDEECYELLAFERALIDARLNDGYDKMKFLDDSYRIDLWRKLEKKSKQDKTEYSNESMKEVGKENQ